MCKTVFLHCSGACPQPRLRGWKLSVFFRSALLLAWSSKVKLRLEICHDHRGQQPCKFFPAVQISPENNALLCLICVEIWNLLICLLSLYTLFSPQNYWYFKFAFPFQQKKRTKIIYIEIYAVFLLTKFVAIYAVLVCKCFSLKIHPCRIFDKFSCEASPALNWLFATEVVWAHKEGRCLWKDWIGLVYTSCVTQP